jgi:hypothetical protein
MSRLPGDVSSARSCEGGLPPTCIHVASWEAAANVAASVAATRLERWRAFQRHTWRHKTGNPNLLRAVWAAIPDLVRVQRSRTEAWDRHASSCPALWPLRPPLCPAPTRTSASKHQTPHRASQRHARALSDADSPQCAALRWTRAGGAKRDRTADLLNAIQALSQLSYGPDRSEGGI